MLLIRDSAGRLSVREFTGTVLAGQEEPRIRVPPPRSKEKKCAGCGGPVRVAQLVPAGSQFLLARETGSPMLYSVCHLAWCVGALYVSCSSLLRSTLPALDATDVAKSNCRLAIEIEEHRLVAHIARELRARQAKIEKKGSGGRAGMTYPEVRRVFPHLKEATVRKHMAEVCDVTKV